MKVNGELDFLFETLGLLYHNYHFDKIKSDLMKDFAEFGINGEVFYQQHLKILDKYILTFTKNRKISSADNFYFGDYDTKFFLFYCDTLMVPLPKVNSECRNKEKQRDILSWKKFDTHLQ